MAGCLQLLPTTGYLGVYAPPRQAHRCVVLGQARTHLSQRPTQEK